VTLRGLTWDHPRGYVVLDALAADGGIRWDRQPLEGFESRPLRTIADDYDLVVIDHPCLGEAVRDGALRPLAALLSDAELAACADASAGRSYASYQLDGQQWALPLDAAAQVSVCRPDLLGERPATWGEACRVARRYPTAVCLGGPHALLMFCAICVSLGAPPGTQTRGFVDQDAGADAIVVMDKLLSHADGELAARNPIGVLDAMAADGGPVYCPLVYGYITYEPALAAFDAPAGDGGIGSVLGGTGIAVTRSCADPAAARRQLLRLVSEEVQVGLYAELGGQSARYAGEGFYSATRRTIDAAWVRPRFAGYVEFQAAASAALRDGLRRGDRAEAILAEVERTFAREREGQQ
jgi:multiple sugar transport system substrate-binding protein